MGFGAGKETFLKKFFLSPQIPILLQLAPGTASRKDDRILDKAFLCRQQRAIAFLLFRNPG
ncbi:MAG: hypothetical protein A2X49_01145 [Lentisphaerae bacterium GWF2_52_8]|nr:MAG: hypothetical protein A2X49_01145 [Lentisphaerae bacterium GWF2_52_8]